MQKPNGMPVNCWYLNIRFTFFWNTSKSFLTSPIERVDFNKFIKENLRDWITYANLNENKDNANQ